MGVVKKVKGILKLEYFEFSRKNSTSGFFSAFSEILARWYLFLSGRLYYSKGGKIFHFEHRNESLFLPVHLALVSKISKELGLDRQDNVTILDIGANVGQFAFAAKQLIHNCTIISFEPNPVPRELLTKNAEKWDKWTIISSGISSRTGEMSFYFVPGKSSQGSVFRDNASLDFIRDKKHKIQETQVHMLGPTELKGILKNYAKFHLIKVDVEGSEMEVLDGLEYINFSYLLIEVNEARSGGITSEQVIAKLYQQNKAAKVLREYGSTESNIKDVLFQITLGIG